MNNNEDKKQLDNEEISKSERFWDISLFGGFLSLQKEMEKSKSMEQTIFIFLRPFVLGGVYIALIIIAYYIFH